MLNIFASNSYDNYVTTNMKYIPLEDLIQYLSKKYNKSIKYQLHRNPSVKDFYIEDDHDLYQILDILAEKYQFKIDTCEDNGLLIREPLYEKKYLDFLMWNSGHISMNQPEIGKTQEKITKNIDEKDEKTKNTDNTDDTLKNTSSNMKLDSTESMIKLLSKINLHASAISNYELGVYGTREQIKRASYLIKKVQKNNFKNITAKIMIFKAIANNKQEIFKAHNMAHIIPHISKIIHELYSDQNTSKVKVFGDNLLSICEEKDNIIKRYLVNLKMELNTSIKMSNKSKSRITIKSQNDKFDLTLLPIIFNSQDLVLHMNQHYERNLSNFDHNDNGYNVKMRINLINGIRTTIHSFNTQENYIVSVPIINIPIIRLFFSWFRRRKKITRNVQYICLLDLSWT